MTRFELMGYLARLDAAAQERALRLEVDLPPAASDDEIARCDELLAVHIPEAYRRSLREWNGCNIGLYERQDGTDVRRAQFSILDTARIVSVTTSLRKSIDMVMLGLQHAEAFRTLMASVVAITDHDDITAFVTAKPDEPDLSVRYVDLEYVATQEPDDLPLIAASPDIYIQKCLEHLTTSLKTEIYWW